MAGTTDSMNSGKSPLVSPPIPALRTCVLTCMDTRINPYDLLGVATGDVHILRNAGGLATPDALRSLILSQHLLSVRNVIIINHTGCGLFELDEERVLRELRARTGADAAAPREFHAFSDLAKTTREQVRKVLEHPWLDLIEEVRGVIYHVETGVLEDVAVRTR